MQLNSILKNIVDNVSGGLGCAVIDTNTGLMIGAHHNAAYFTQSFVDAVAATAADMFRGQNVQTVEKLLGQQRGQDMSGLTNEIQITTDTTYHFISLVPGSEHAIVTLITSRDTNLGMGWSVLRRSFAKIYPHCV